MIRLSRKHHTHLAGTTPDENERGSVTLENVLVWPIVIVFIFGFFQAALWFHARDVAHSAATNAYYQARLYDSSAQAGVEAGNKVIQNSGTTINGGAVNVSRTATTVTVTVTGSTSMIVKGWPGSALSETVTGPVERYVGP